MFAIRQFQRSIAVLAGLAILFAALAPAIAQTLSERTIGKNGWTELCTAYGRKVVRIDMGQDASAQQLDEAARHFERCPFCQINTAFLPPEADTSVQAREAVRRAPRLSYQAPTPLFAWHGAQPRAPPPLS